MSPRPSSKFNFTNKAIKAKCAISLFRSSAKHFLMKTHPKVGMIATMPKSGTWYCHYFINFYSQLLKGKKNIDAIKKVTINTGPHFRPEIGLDLFHICHAICPGFHHYQGDHKISWDKLTFHIKGYDHAGRRISQFPFLYDPEINTNVKIVYIYRNPLDQAVSFFHHIQKHKDEEAKSWINEDGEKIPFENVWDFVNRCGLEAYIKQFMTFKCMKILFPGNILTIPYERLFRDPYTTFQTVLRHFGHDPMLDSRVESYNKAIKLSSIDSMKQIENNLGRSLGNDQADPNERHVRDGTVGKWKSYLDESNILKIESRLNQFDLSLKEFEIE